MPATAGRVRMPHNNRVSTGNALKTSDIWSKTIGHDPYANQSEDATNAAAAESNAEKARGLLELARHQNLTGGRSGGAEDDFARKMFLGLKPGKKRSSVIDPNKGGNLDADARALLEEESSSSEDEFVQPDAGAGPKEDRAPSSSDTSSSSDESRERRRRRKRKEKKRSKSRSRHRKKKAKKRRRREDEREERSSPERDSSDSDSSVEDRRKKRRRRHREGKKKRH